MNGKLKRERGSGNVFADIGFPPDEAHNLMLRAELMTRIRKAAKGLTQAEAARRFGVTQPRINDLLRGKIDKFSLDTLFDLAGRSGLKVSLALRKAA